MEPVPGPACHRISGRRRSLAATVATVAAMALLLGACGSDDDTTTTDTDAATSSTSSSTTEPPSSSTSDGSGSSSTSDGADLPGDPWEGFAQEGDVLAVLGVAHDDELNVRAIPGTDGDIVATAAPTADDLVATGEGRQLEESLWYEVTVGDTTGWVSARYVAFAAATDDATAEYLDRTGQDRPEVETMVELGQLVAEEYASAEPPSSIVQSVAPTVGDLGEVTFDVVGLGDDSIMGYRLHVFGTPSESGEGFVLDTIERTTFCSRGSDGEICA